MTPSVLDPVAALLRRCRSSRVRLWTEDDRLKFEAPRGALGEDLRAALVAHRAEVVTRLSTLSERWGPALEDTEPPIAIPTSDWRWQVANLPQAEWSRWRHRTNELLAALGHQPTAEEIREAERQAYDELVATAPHSSDSG